MPYLCLVAGGPTSLRTGARLAVVLSLVLTPRFGMAAIHTVSDFGDSGAAGQLRTLVGAAAPGDTILIPAGTIVFGGAALTIDKDLTIVGAGPELTVLDAASLSGVVQITAGHAALSGMTLRNGNAAGAGGGIDNHGTAVLVGAVVENCSSTGGGGISNGGTMTVQTVTVRGNSTHGVSAPGGGILNFGNMTVTESTIHGNATAGTSSSANGGGIENAGSMTITNSTISGNSAIANWGGGIYHATAGTSLHLAHVTIADNQSDSDGSARGGGGGLGAMGGGVSVVNSIIADNRTGFSRTPSDCSGTFDSLEYTLLTDASAPTVTGSIEGTVLARHAQLEALADNGGPTLTHALRATSPAVDGGAAAACVAADQRGQLRPADGNRDGVVGCDMGGFELIRR